MGRRGPAPLPTPLLKARRGYQRKSGKNARTHEPDPVPGHPDKPTALAAAASRIWDTVAEVIADGVLTTDNGASLSRYAHMLARWWKLAKWLDDGNEEVCEKRDAQGNNVLSRHPNLVTYENLNTSLLRMEQEFGLTPASRTRVATIARGGGAQPRGHAVNAAAGNPPPVAATAPPTLRIA